MWETGMLSAQQTHCPHVCNSRPFSLLVGAWGDRAQGMCKALKARQKLWLQVTPETTCGRFLEECKEERRAAVLGWGMQGRGWGVGWMQAFIGLSALPTKLPASGKPRGTKQNWWALDLGLG